MGTEYYAVMCCVWINIVLGAGPWVLGAMGNYAKYEVITYFAGVAIALFAVAYVATWVDYWSIDECCWTAVLSVWSCFMSGSKMLELQRS